MVPLECVPAVIMYLSEVKCHWVSKQVLSSNLTGQIKFILGQCLWLFAKDTPGQFEQETLAGFGFGHLCSVTQMADRPSSWTVAGQKEGKVLGVRCSPGGGLLRQLSSTAPSLLLATPAKLVYHHLTKTIRCHRVTLAARWWGELLAGTVCHNWLAKTQGDLNVKGMYLEDADQSWEL